MFNINKYLERFSKNINSTEEDLLKINNILKNSINIDISIKDIEIKNYIIYIKSNNSILNKIFINKNKILEEVSKSLNQKIVDIK